MTSTKTTSATKAQPAPANDGQASDLRTLTDARFSLIGDALGSIDDLAEAMRHEATQQKGGRVYVERLEHISKLANNLMLCTDVCNDWGDRKLSAVIGWREDAPAGDAPLAASLPPSVEGDGTAAAATVQPTLNPALYGLAYEATAELESIFAVLLRELQGVAVSDLALRGLAIRAKDLNSIVGSYLGGDTRETAEMHLVVHGERMEASHV
jgi:hypothetical protein